MASNISEALLKDKLYAWTASNKIQETLGLTSMDVALFKKELTALESKGIIERAGAKKGLKFRYKVSQPAAQPTLIKEKVEQIDTQTKETKKKNKPKVSIEDIPCAISNMDKHSYTEEVTNAPLNNILGFLTKSPGDYTFSLSIKRTSKGLCVKTYRDIFLMSEVFYTKENFLLLLKASGITIE